MRNPLKRGTDIPDDVRDRAGLHSRAKVLAATPATDGSWLLGTRDALVIVAADGSTRIPWEQVEQADWDRENERFQVLEVGEFGKPRPEHTFAIEDPGLLLPFVRERVTASVVLQRRVIVSGKRGFIVIARRPPSGGEITWAYEFDSGINPDDPMVQQAAEKGLRLAAEELGLS